MIWKKKKKADEKKEKEQEAKQKASKYKDQDVIKSTTGKQLFAYYVNIFDDRQHVSFTKFTIFNNIV